MKNIIFLSFFLCLILACVKEGPPGPKGPDGPPYTWPPGNITGYVELRDQFGAILEGEDSVLLRSYNADSIFSAYTDSNGYFNLQAIPPGNYDISLSKPGFDSLHIYLQHAGGEIDKFTGITSMSQHVTTKLVSLTATHYYQSGSFVVVPFKLEFEWPIPGLTSVPEFRFYADTSSIHGSGRGQGTLVLVSVNTNASNNGVMDGRIILMGYPIPASGPLYVTVVAAPAWNLMRSWLDYTTGSVVPYPYLGDSIKTITSDPE